MKKILCFFKETLLSRGPGIYKRADHLCTARPYFHIVYHMSARIPYPETKKAPETLNCYLKNRWDIPPAPYLHRVHRVRHLLHVISHRAGGVRSMLRDERDDRGADDGTVRQCGHLRGLLRGRDAEEVSVETSLPPLRPNSTNCYRRGINEKTRCTRKAPRTTQPRYRRIPTGRPMTASIERNTG